MTNSVSQPQTHARGLARAGALAVLTAALVVAMAPGRTRAQQPVGTGSGIRFDVASIKLNVGDSRIRLARTLPGGRWLARGMTLRDLIRTAYYPDGIFLDSQIAEGPDWLDTARFDIDATAEEGSSPGETAARHLRMAQALLAERFKLAVRKEPRPLDSFQLVMLTPGKPGQHLVRSTCVRNDQPAPPAGAPARPCNPMKLGGGGLAIDGITMPELAATLANMPAVGRYVHDQTGLQGTFDLQLKFVGQVLLNGQPNPDADSGPGLLTALQEQLGLKLVSHRGPVSVLVVERAERPTEN